MVKITVGTDCGNAPKREFLKDLNIAFVENNIDYLTESVTDDIVWNMIGENVIEGKADFVSALEQMQEVTPTELVITKVITHGREGAVNGTITMSDGKRYAFADVYEFSGAKGTHIKSIESYVIEIQA